MVGEGPEESAWLCLSHSASHSLDMVWGIRPAPPLRGQPRCSWRTVNVHHAECLAPGWAQERGEETLQCGGREVNHWEVRDDSDLVLPRQS